MAKTSRPSTAEQTIIRIMRRLTPERARQLVDFARFLELQTTIRYADWLDETDETVHAGDEQWDRLLAQPEAKKLMHEMAREEYQAGQTTDIEVTDDGRLTSA